MSETGLVHTIGQVSALLGVPAPTIRSWERRHGLRPEGHSPAGHRRYDDQDLAELGRMRDEIAAGRGAAEAASIVRSLRGGAPALLAHALCEAAYRLDDLGVERVLDRARVLHGLAGAVELVLFPALRELGEQWSRGLCDVAPEHLLTTTVQAWLVRARPTASIDPAQPPVVLACGPDEHHTLALDALGVLLAHRGLRTLHLGARVPGPSLRTAVHDSGAHAVVLTCQLGRNRRSAVGALRELSASPVDVLYAGAAFATPATRRDVHGHYLGAHLADSVDQVEERLRTRGAARGSAGRLVRNS